MLEEHIDIYWAQKEEERVLGLVISEDVFDCFRKYDGTLQKCQYANCG
jgi:hypothetical protein